MSRDPAALAVAVGRIREAERIGLACHIGPDGDALGSMLGFAVAAAAAGKTVYPSFGEPHTVPDAYRFLPTGLLVPPRDVPVDLDVFLTFDSGSLDRIGDLAAAAGGAKSLIVLDHHPSNDGFGTVDLIDPTAAATGEIVLELLDELGWPLDPVVATCLHTAIVTDTGRFQYSNTSPATLRAAARLVEAGARPEEVGRHVYEESRFGYLAVCGAVLSRARLVPDRRLVWSVVTEADLEAAGITLDDADLLIDAVRVARESDVAALFKEVGNDRVKVSLRSRGRVDVGAIATELGGGGHHNAAGCTLRGTAETALAEVLARLEPVEPLPPDGGDG